MDINDYKKYEPVDGKWYFGKKLGNGAFGTVFEMERKDLPGVKTALKVISIPQSESELESFRQENYTLDDKSITSYYYSFVESFRSEIQLMMQLSGNTNIVSYMNDKVIEHEDGIGWDILILMELLTPMSTYFKKNKPTEANVIKLGIDMCRALEVCRSYNIIHRDIKPANIFVSRMGDFKLGDFGVARTLEKTSGMLSKKGTVTYMAPEVYRGDKYDATVDIYSLGIVMYKLLNRGMDPFRKDMTYEDIENASYLRLSGEKMPPPSNASDKLSKIILKACAYSPDERYKTATELKKELEALSVSAEAGEENEASGHGFFVPEDDEETVTTAQSNESDDTIGVIEKNCDETVVIADADDKTIGLIDKSAPEKPPEKEKPTKPADNTAESGKRIKKSWIIGGAAALAAVIAVVGIVAGVRNADHNIKTNEIELDRVAVNAEDGSKKGISELIGLNGDAEVTASSDNKDVASIVVEDGITYIICEDIGSASVTYRYSESVSDKEENLYKGAIDLTVVMSASEKAELDSGITEVNGLLAEAKALLEKIQNSTNADHANFAGEEPVLVNAINELEGKISTIGRAADILSVKQYYNEAVKPAMDNLNAAYEKAVKIATDQAAAAAAAASAGQSKSSGSTSTKPSGGTSTKPSGGTSVKPSSGTSKKPSGSTSTKPSGGTSTKPSGGTSVKPSSGSSGASSGGSSGSSSGGNSGARSGDVGGRSG